MATYSPQSGVPMQMEPQPRTGMGCGAKILIALGILFLLLILVCCGSVFGVKYYITKSITDDPDKVREITQKITEIDVPSPLEAEAALDMRVPFSKKTMIMAAVYSNEGKKNWLALMCIGNVFDEPTQAKIRQSLENAMLENRTATQAERLNKAEESTKEVTIRGEKTVFKITKGIAPKSQESRIRVEGAFPGEVGSVMLMLDADAKEMPEEKVDKMLESIH